MNLKEDQPAVSIFPDAIIQAISRPVSRPAFLSSSHLRIVFQEVHAGASLWTKRISVERTSEKADFHGASLGRDITRELGL